MNKHKHRDVIVAWADGAKVEYRCKLNPVWSPIDEPSFVSNVEYRIKPEPPAKVYPVTGMRYDQLSEAWGREFGNRPALYSVANAALRHAIDNNQLVEPLAPGAVILTVGDKQYRVNNARNAARDMAIAKAVSDAVHASYVPCTFDYDLPAIIATVKE
jgi:hypothetical protein